MPSSASAGAAADPRALHGALPIFQPIGRRPAGGKLRLGVGVDVAELGSEADVQAGVASAEVLLGVATQPRLNPPPNRVRDSDPTARSQEHTSELQSPCNLVCRLLPPPAPRPTRVPYTALFRSSSPSAGGQPGVSSGSV